jgi:hypothetical protein
LNHEGHKEHEEGGSIAQAQRHFLRAFGARYFPAPPFKMNSLDARPLRVL